MEIHNPKPVHNWHEFLTELGTIVLGICIALAGEQALEELHWRNQVREAREVITTEMTYNLEGAIWRTRTINCAEQRLDDLAKILDEASRSGNLPAVGYISQAPRHMWRSGAWESVVASQAAAHFPSQQLADLAALYKIVQRLEEYAAPDAIAWSDLYAMVGPGRRLDPTTEAVLRTALNRARNSGRTMATLSTFLITQAAAMHLPFTSSELEQVAAARTGSLTHPQEGIELTPMSPTSICGPIGPVPPNYGEAPTKESVAFVNAANRKLPDFSRVPP